MNMMFVLVLSMFAGPMSSGDSVALETVPGFATEAACVEAGEKAEGLAQGTMKKVKFVCLEVPRP